MRKEGQANTIFSSFCGVSGTKSVGLDQIRSHFKTNGGVDQAYISITCYSNLYLGVWPWERCSLIASEQMIHCISVSGV